MNTFLYICMSKYTYAYLHSRDLMGMCLWRTRYGKCARALTDLAVSPMSSEHGTYKTVKALALRQKSFKGGRWQDFACKFGRTRHDGDAPLVGLGMQVVSLAGRGM